MPVDHVWTHKKWCRPSDPINVVFKDLELDDIKSFLASKGFRKPDRFTAFDHVIPDPDPVHKRKQDLQLVKSAKWRLIKRYHIRFWKTTTEIVSNIHMDALRAFGHTASDFESIEKWFSKDVCKENDDWEVLEDAEELDNKISMFGQPYNNGKATVVKRKI